jgi:hypothetical protein
MLNEIVVRWIFIKFCINIFNSHYRRAYSSRQCFFGVFFHEQDIDVICIINVGNEIWEKNVIVIIWFS